MQARLDTQPDGVQLANMWVHYEPNRAKIARRIRLYWATYLLFGVKAPSSFGIKRATGMYCVKGGSFAPKFVLTGRRSFQVSLSAAPMPSGYLLVAHWIVVQEKHAVRVLRVGDAWLAGVWLRVLVDSGVCAVSPQARWLGSKFIHYFSK